MGLLTGGIPRKDNGKIDFTPRRHHGWTIFIVILGFLLPPLAVAARFGFGRDFCINVVLTLMGYLPGHGHNFFIQNVRNNDNKARTPKWAKRYGLVDDTANKKLQKQRQWVGRYNDQAPQRNQYDENGQVHTYDHDHRYEDGDVRRERAGRSNSGGEPESFYNNNDDGYSIRSGTGGGRQSRNSSSDIIPGAGEAERRRAKSKSRARGFLGRNKSSSGKADRHLKSNQVMGDELDGYDPSLDSFERRSGSGGGRHGSYADADSFDGPEDADMTVGKRLRNQPTGTSNGRDADRYNGNKSLPAAPAVDIMNDNHQF